MSYDIQLTRDACQHCGRYSIVWDISPTYNLAPIFNRLCPPSLDELDGKPASVAAEKLGIAIARLDDAELRRELRGMEPSNGWGTLEDAIEVLYDFKSACERYADCVVGVT